MASPQPEPFVKFSKELFDALLRSHMPATHKEIVLAVIRCTYGNRGRKSAPISQTLLQQMIGRHKNGIRQSLRELVTEGVIVQVSAPSFGASAVLSLNKDYETWGKWSVRYSQVEDPQDLGEVQQGVPGEVQQGVPGEVQQGVPIEDIETRDINIPSGDESPKETPQTIVAFAVDRARAAGVALTKAVTGQLAAEVGRQFKAGADPILIRDAVGTLVDENKSPARLSYVMRDILKGGGHGRVAAISGRSTNGEW